MKWWDKPLSPIARALVMISIGAVALALEALTTPAGFIYVFRGAEWLPVRWAAWGLIVYGGVQVGRSLLTSR